MNPSLEIPEFTAEGPVVLRPLGFTDPLRWLAAGWRDFLRCPPGIAFNELLFRTFRLELWFAALLSAAALLGRMIG